MLTIIVPGDEMFDEENERFLTEGDFELQLEHSLASLSKWESSHEKPFLDGVEKSAEEVMDYIKAMTLTPDVPPEVFGRMSQQNFDAVNDYIGAKMTATWFGDSPEGKKSNEVITSELIYFWMFTYSVPIECEHWHLNRLFTVIRVCNAKNAPQKKIPKREVLLSQHELNEKRKKEYGTTG